MTYFIVLLTVVNVAFGYFGGMFRHNGYNAYNFVYFFVIGRYLHIISKSERYKLFSKYSLAVWLLCAIPLAIGFLLVSKFKVWDESFAQNYFGYNNPFVILSSVSLFIAFSVMKIKSNAINQLAKGVFGIFLLHTTTIFIYYRIEVIGLLYKQYGYIAVFLSSIALFVACCLISFVIEKVKTPVFNKIRSQIKF